MALTHSTATATAVVSGEAIVTAHHWGSTHVSAAAGSILCALFFAPAMAAPPRIIIAGAPASGKGTQARRTSRARDAMEICMVYACVHACMCASTLRFACVVHPHVRVRTGCGLCVPRLSCAVRTHQGAVWRGPYLHGRHAPGARRTCGCCTIALARAHAAIVCAGGTALGKKAKEFMDHVSRCCVGRTGGARAWCAGQACA